MTNPSLTQDVDFDNPATCIGCGCTDTRACPGGCYWLAVDRDAMEGVCSNCPAEKAGFMAAYRESGNTGARS